MDQRYIFIGLISIMAMVVGLLSVYVILIATVMVEGDDDHVVNVVTFATFTID